MSKLKGTPIGLKALDFSLEKQEYKSKRINSKLSKLEKEKYDLFFSIMSEFFNCFQDIECLIFVPRKNYQSVSINFIKTDVINRMLRNLQTSFRKFQKSRFLESKAYLRIHSKNSIIQPLSNRTFSHLNYDIYYVSKDDPNIDNLNSSQHYFKNQIYSALDLESMVETFNTKRLLDKTPSFKELTTHNCEPVSTVKLTKFFKYLNKYYLAKDLIQILSPVVSETDTSFMLHSRDLDMVSRFDKDIIKISKHLRMVSSLELNNTVSVTANTDSSYDLEVN